MILASKNSPDDGALAVALHHQGTALLLLSARGLLRAEEAVSKALDSFRALEELGGFDSVGTYRAEWDGDREFAELSEVFREELRAAEGRALAGPRRSEFPESDALHVRAARANLTTAFETWQEEGSATEEGTGAIDDASPAVDTDVAPTVEFGTAAAADRVKGHLLVRASDQDIEDLTAMILAAQKQAPEDKLGFVLEMRRMLAAGGLELRMEGIDGAVQVAMKNGSIAVSTNRKGTRGFRGAELSVVRADEPTFAPDPRYADTPKQAQAPS